MRHSLALRLGLIVAAIILISFVGLQWVVYRSTSIAFLEIEQLGHAEDSESSRTRRIAAALQNAVAIGGVAATREVADSPGRAGLLAGDAFMVLDAELAVVASTEPALVGERARRAEGTADLSIDVVRNADRGVQSFSLAGLVAQPLSSTDAGPGATFVVLPSRADPTIGDRFAAGVWRSAALGLIAIMALSILVTMVVMRRSLAPIDRLTAAARLLQKGEIPPPLGRQGSKEFGELFDAFDSATAAIARTDDLRKRFISDTAHELRTPVTNLKVQLEALDAGLVLADEKFMASLRADTQLLEGLVEDFQQLAIADAGRLRLNLQDLPLDEALESMLEPLAECSGAVLRLSAPTGLSVRADEQRLRQVLVNLFENALRHRPSGLVISLSATRQGDTVNLLFADNGPGIDPDDRPHVFERFYRAEKSRSRATGGAGLGLAIARGMVQAMGGAIDLVDAAEAGACFAIRLPAATNADAETS
jgi:signal transduction histidine kinase